MGGWWAFWAGVAVVLGWAIYVDLAHHSDNRLARWWLGRAREWGAATGPLSFLLSAGALAAFGGLTWAADAVAERAGNPLWALVATAPAMLVYAPFSLATAPTQYGGYLAWRRALREAGADHGQQRAIAWWAGPPSLMGFIAIAFALASAFVPDL